MLATSKISQSSLKNLEFHQVEWEVQQLQNLGLLLDNSNIKQVVFKRNKFDQGCLSEVSEILKRNRVIKEIMFSESCVRNVGAAFLASALKESDCLEELQIWENSIGSKGAEELSKMIEVNSTLKSLTIFDSSSITATPLVSAVLARNRTMEFTFGVAKRETRVLKWLSLCRETAHLESTGLMFQVLVGLLALWG